VTLPAWRCCIAAGCWPQSGCRRQCTERCAISYVPVWLAAVRAVRTARQQLSVFLLRHERIYPGDRKPWMKAHRRWLAGQSFAQAAQQIVLREGTAAVRLGEESRRNARAPRRQANNALYYRA
jgi:hypothetical protein